VSVGSIYNAGTIAGKSAYGLHLNGLFVGSEGNLDCITELTLKVQGLREHVLAARANFTDIKDATEAVIAIMQAGIRIARVELVDAVSIEQINQHSDVSFSVALALFIELHGTEAGIQQYVVFMDAI